MKISLIKIVAVLSLAIVIFVSVCTPSLAALRRAEECGVERFNSKADEVCGTPTYVLARSDKCGVELYKQQKSKECPGYVSADSNWFRLRGNASESCPQGYQFTGSTRTITGECCDECSRPRCTQIPQVYCSRPETVPTCRLAKFGVERYLECRNLAHGIESFPTCERPEFGVASYNECEIRKTRAELIPYIANLESSIDVMGVALLNSSGNLLKLDRNETGLACYIKRWESDPLYSDAISELKTIQFPALFGVPYDPNKYDCSGSSSFSPPTTACSDESPRCKFQTAYNASVEFFRRNREEVTALLNDVVARNDETVKARLQALNAKLDNYFKS